MPRKTVHQPPSSHNEKGRSTPLRLPFPVSIQNEDSCQWGNTRACALGKGFRIKELTVCSLGSTELAGDLLPRGLDKNISDSIWQKSSGPSIKSGETSVLMWAQLSRPLLIGSFIFAMLRSLLLLLHALGDYE